MVLKKIVCAAGCVLALVSCATATVEGGRTEAGSDGRSSAPAPGNDDKARGPDFVVQTFEGGTFSLAEHRGTPVVLNFWESW